MKQKLSILFLLLWGQFALAQEAIWLRYPSISPDGKHIVFSYQGDLYRVSSKGGKATLLTLHEAYDRSPVWSNDGQYIAFASDRFGNFDVFIMPAEGGTPKRLTYHSANDIPSDFSPDGKHVIFSSARLDDPKHAQFPRGTYSELYQVSLEGTRPEQLLTVPAPQANYASNKNMIVFEEVKGGESNERKHHTSSITRDIWTYDFEKQTFTQIANFEGEDREPVFAPNGESVFYLSEKSGSFNVFEVKLSNPNQAEQVSQFEKHPLRYLSMSDNGTLCYTYDGVIYTQTPGANPIKIAVEITNDNRYNERQFVKFNNQAREMALSPNGKEVAFVVRGEVFVTSVETGTTKRITNTPEQERSVSFSPDGRAILYTSERGQSWNLYQTKLSRDEEKYFFNATLLKEEAILESEEETFQPSYSPDGKEVAFLENRTTLRVIKLANKEVRTVLAGDVNYSYSDGDQYYEWSPDGKWFVVDFLPPKQWIREVGLVKADSSGEIENLTKSGYADFGGKWAMEGEMIIYGSDRNGMRSHASWGSQDDVYALFLTQEAYDKFQLSKEEFDLAKEVEKDKKKEESKDKSKDDKKDKTKEKEPIQIEFEGIENRRERLTIHSSSLGGFVLSKDGEKLYYLARFESGYDLWETELRSRKTKILAKLGGGGGALALDKDGKHLFLLSRGRISKINLSNGKRESISFNAEMQWQPAEERAYLFEHIWRQVKRKFYVEDLHGVDWDFYKKAYAKFLPHINNNYDFADLASELLGELNASHTGCYYRGRSVDNPDQTAALGLFYDKTYQGKGLKIAEVMEGSPVEKKGSKIKAGVIIEKIDGQEIAENANYYPLLNRKAGENTLLSLYNPTSQERWEEVLKPISTGQENRLRYRRWVKRNEAMVEKLSKGKLGYVHVQGMNEGSFRVVYENALGKYAQKAGLIVDTRNNGGGWLHDDLATFLNGKNYMKFEPRGQHIGNEPQFKWAKPSVVLMNEANYSDAHMFPYTYKYLGIGKLIGMPVPGTGTAVWWENLQDNTLTFGIPQVGMVGNDGKYLENTQLEPDIKVKNDFKALMEGRDQQLERAVEELLR